MEINNVYLGDCNELIKGIKDNEIDVSFTSPPYFDTGGGETQE